MRPNWGGARGLRAAPHRRSAATPDDWEDSRGAGTAHRDPLARSGCDGRFAFIAPSFSSVRPPTRVTRETPRPRGRRWPASCWRPPKTVGGRSTAPPGPTGCVPAPGSRAARSAKRWRPAAPWPRPRIGTGPGSSAFRTPQDGAPHRDRRRHPPLTNCLVAVIPALGPCPHRKVRLAWARGSF
jgi:hypothetical protein